MGAALYLCTDRAAAVMVGGGANKGGGSGAGEGGSYSGTAAVAQCTGGSDGWCRRLQ